jgi:hypothetical protein
MENGTPAPEQPPSRGPSLLWSIALGLIVISVVVSLLTPYKLFILFLPIGLAPLFFSRAKRGGR